MTFPVRITWKNHDPSPAMEAYIQEQAERLERFSTHIIDSHITIETPHRHHSHGRHFLAVLDVHVPGKEFVANRDPQNADNHEDLHAAVHDAFTAMRKQLQHHFDRLRDSVRHPGT